ncbi:alpha/beta fold hydrolase [Promicromonospora thailandica]|uniref:Pimeloyl-ACP methyl ester carboxylesterase n=1 Tax=Promicromonospora thailandica TaxID=765201 RepID=A0A9X2JUG0_9MICO|nr:alpha/beta hydrolase [Promicromonospora thailandica]MCP2264480.1 Pimeloyl-ACP methyl ester carboxylesterase [Promicromonospora thailandica]BFF20460.1 alpha/beta hydrolase [Promicromonospora thailandica]
MDSYLQRPEGRIAYSDTGSGPLVVAVPGMGVPRSTYDDVVPALVAAGHRVVVADLRGHGDSDTTFRTHGDDATGADLLALVEHLDAGPAVIMGNSMGASAAAWAAAERPDLVRGLVLLSPLLRDPASPLMQRLMPVLFRVLLARPWGAAFWASYYSSISKGRRSPQHAEHVAAIRDSMREPGHLRSFRDLAIALDHSVVEERLPAVQAPALVVVGALDPDYPDPAAELAWMTEAIDARGVLIPDVGHYPQRQAPDDVVREVLEFLAGLPAGAAPAADGGPRA